MQQSTIVSHTTRPTVAQARQQYDRYARALERDYRNKYVAVSPDAKTVIAPTLAEALEHAAAQFGPGNLVFKIGSRAVGTWR